MTKRVIFIVVLAVMIFPQFQRVFHPIKSMGLKGAFVPATKPSFACSTWYAGTFQEKFIRYYNESVGFRPDYVRLQNQVDYSVYTIPHGDDLVMGENGILFQMGYIIGYQGKTFPGKKFIDERVRKLSYIQKCLWKKNILVLVVIPPDKGSFWSDMLPSRFKKDPNAITAGDYFAAKAREYNIPVIDCNPWFKQLKDTSGFLLMTYTGMHWSDYGAFLAADSTFHFLKQKSKAAEGLPELKIERIELSDIARHDDADLEKTMNMIWPLPHPPLAYPVISYVQTSAAPKPKALFVGDSFFWQWYFQDIIQKSFANTEFWYYDKTIFPESFQMVRETKDVDLRKSIESKDFLILVQVGAGNGDPGAGIINRLYNLYDTVSRKPSKGKSP